MSSGRQAGSLSLKDDNVPYIIQGQYLVYCLYVVEYSERAKIYALVPAMKFSGWG